MNIILKNTLFTIFILYKLPERYNQSEKYDHVRFRNDLQKDYSLEVKLKKLSEFLLCELKTNFLDIHYETTQSPHSVTKNTYSLKP